MGVKRVTDKEQEEERNEPKLTYDLSYEDVVDILEVIDHSMGGELHVELGDLKLTVVKRGPSVSTFQAGQGEVAPAHPSGREVKSAAADKEKGIQEKG